MRIVVCEPQCWGLEHAHFNASVLDTVLFAFPDAHVVFRAEPGHLREVREVLEGHDPLGAGRIEWSALEIPPRQLVGWPRLIAEYSWAREVIGADDTVLLCSITSPGIVAVKSLLYGRRRHTPVLAIMHSVLRTMFDRQSVRPSTWLHSMRHAMALPHPRALRFVTLGDSILRNLRETAPRAARHFVSVEMPYLMHDVPSLDGKDPRPGGRTRFGFLGVGNATKRFDWFSRIATVVGRRVPGAAEFTIVGYVPGAVPAEAGAVTGIQSVPLEGDEYRRRAADTTYVVSTADPMHYQLLGSATFLDSLAFGKPGIFLRSRYLEHYFGLMGDIGYLCDTYDAVLATIETISREFPTARYVQQCENVRKHRERFSPQQLASQMREAMSQLRPTPAV
jgi:hypothetical protein